MTPYRDASLEQTLHRVSTVCLGGEPVPAALRAWWALTLRMGEVPGVGDLLRPVDHDRVIAERGLLDGPHGDWLVLAEGALAELSLIAEGDSGGLMAVGYWRRPNTPIERCPVVGIDDEGQMALLGRSLEDALASRVGWEPRHAARLDAFRAAFALEGITQRADPRAIFDALREDPELAAPFRDLSLRWQGVSERSPAQVRA